MSCFQPGRNERSGELARRSLQVPRARQ